MANGLWMLLNHICCSYQAPTSLGEIQGSQQVQESLGQPRQVLTSHYFFVYLQYLLPMSHPLEDADRI
jgi:hypothetical protein